MKKTVSKKKEKIRDKILDCEFSQKEFLFFRKKYSGTSGRINKTELQNAIFIMAKSHFATSLPMFLVFYSFLFQV
ncbi:hypothetical protein KUS10_004257 [Escherichia coli]|nr:hypothetical protein [Escherichia coli]